MEDKSGIIINTLIEKLKKNSQFFGDITHTETYRVVVIKQTT